MRNTISGLNVAETLSLDSLTSDETKTTERIIFFFSILESVVL